MATAAPEFDDNDEIPEVETSADPARLRKYGGYARATHTKSLKRARLAVRVNEEEEPLRTIRGIQVRDFEEVERRHQLLLLNADLTTEEIEAEIRWLDNVTVEHQAALQDIDRYLAPRSTTSRAKTTSGHSIRSNTSSVRARLAKSTRLAAEAELRVKQAQEEAKIREEEDQILSSLQASTRQIEERRRMRDLMAQKEKHELTGQLLRQQLIDEDVYESPLRDDTSVSRAIRSVINPISSQPRRDAIITTRPMGFQLATRETLENATSRPALPVQQGTHTISLLPPVKDHGFAANVMPHYDPYQTPRAGPEGPARPSGLDTDPVPSLPLTRSQHGQQPSAVADPAVPRTQQRLDGVTPYASDAWIRDVGNQVTSAPITSHRPPKLALPRFNGSPRDWPMFIQSFRVQVHDACASDAERLAHLRGCLSVDIQRSLGETILNPGLYKFALEELQRKYGSPYVVAQACVSSLLNLQAFKDNDYKAMRSFSSTLHSVVATLRLGGYGMELHSTATLAQLVAKLPPSLRSRWGIYSYGLRALPTVGDLDQWLDYMTMAESSVRTNGASHEEQTGADKNDKSKNKNQNKRGNGLPAGVFGTSALACPLCEGKHGLPTCKQFKQLTPDKRAELVKDKRVCYRCLASDHLSPNCSSTATCNKSECRRLHHPLLHGAPRMFPSLKAPDGTTESPDNVGTSSALKIPSPSDVAGKRPVGHSTLLPVVKAFIHGPTAVS